VTVSPRVPVVTATPRVGAQRLFVHLSVGGFNNNAAVQVSITGQPNFNATLTGVPTSGCLRAGHRVQRNGDGPGRFRIALRADFLYDSRGSSVALTLSASVETSRRARPERCWRRLSLSY